MIGMREQDEVQAMIDSATTDEKEIIRIKAISILTEMQHLARIRILNSSEVKMREIQVEILTRLEATEKGKGSFFRAYRRLQIASHYL